MMIKTVISIFFLLTLLHAHASPPKQLYIVYLGAHSHPLHATEEDFKLATDYHHRFLASYLGSYEEAKNTIVYSYNKHINGFAAKLDEHQAAKIAENPKVVSVFPSRVKELHTTHSWEFLDLEDNGATSLWSKATYGEDTIIGNLDTGVWPESKSFSDEGFGPVPSRWKGTCEGSGITCNRKLIGARFFNAYGGEDESSTKARDFDGHGTHTLSTAGGSFVEGANVFGYGNGTAKGGSPKARVAAYKVCWEGCDDVDVLAGFDSAIQDGVDVLSVSFGSSVLLPYTFDSVSIGSFHAVQRGITVVCSAGNYGPGDYTVSNFAPWIITVGASTLDREFRAFLELNDGQTFKGQGMSEHLPEDKFYPLVRAVDAKLDNASSTDPELCIVEALDPSKVKDKIVVCLRGKTSRVSKGEAAKRAGAIGMILCNDQRNGNKLIADPHFLPATHITYADGLAVYAYLASTKPDETGAFITHPRTVLNTKPAPYVAAFSSRGPNFISPEILKPDVTAPGVNVVAAFTEAIGPSESPNDKRRTPFTVMSGTSMSCPHIAGVVGLLKTLHPNWSPAAIRSAIMTSARTRDNTEKPMKDSMFAKATPFDHGAGHVRPNAAMEPGLVYDLTITDHLDFLCASGYDDSDVLKMFYNGTYQCPEPGSPRASLLNYNNPAITVPSLSGSVTLTRRVKNVGPPGTYTSSIHHPIGVSVTVEPKTLKFDKVGVEKSFSVTLKATHQLFGYSFGGLNWSDGKRHVRSPIVVASDSN